MPTKTTVSGFTIRRGFDHFDHTRRSITQNSRSERRRRVRLVSAFQYHQLLPQGDDFKPQVMTRTNEASQPREQTQDKPIHESVLITRLEGALVVDPPDCVLATYSGGCLAGSDRGRKEDTSDCCDFASVVE